MNVGTFPRNPYPSHLTAFSIDNSAVIFASFDNWNLDTSIYSFMLASGFGITDDTRKKFVTMGDGAIRTFISREPEKAIPMRKVDDDTIAVPITLLGNALLLVCSRFDNFTEIGRNFVVQHAARLIFNGDNRTVNNEGNERLVDLIVSQLNIRANILARQIEAFPHTLHVEASFTGSCQFKVEEKGKTIPTTSQLLTRQFIRNGTFPTFVLNLWWNTPRRKYMLSQLTRSGLLPSSYLIFGIDSLSLTQYIYTTGLDKSAVLLEGAIASGLAHVQALKEIMKGALPFGLILEDDVELSEGLTCNLAKMLQSPDLPTDWDVIYLEYVIDNYWPDEEKRNGVPEMCFDSINGAPPESFVRLDGVCSNGNVRAFIVSAKGARSLYHLFFPLREPVDVRLRSAIFVGLVDAYYYVPPKAKGIEAAFFAKAKEASKEPGISQHVSRTHKFNDNYTAVVHTYNPDFDRDIDCNIDACFITVL